ncbi:terminase small subunit [Haliea sp.]|uniref:terminase small subunit n=1 Tax=Haliea sp. TaxID=1932666 RepID=UPI0035288683
MKAVLWHSISEWPNNTGEKRHVDEKTMMTTEALTQKQLLFVENYIQTGGNGTAAARAAGYRGSSATLGAVAHENLNKPHIIDAVARRQRKIRQRLEITTQAKRERLWALATEAGGKREVSRTEEVEVAPDGTIVRTIYVEMSPFDPAAAIKAIKELNIMDGDYTVKQRGRYMW